VLFRSPPFQGLAIAAALFSGFTCLALGVTGCNDASTSTTGSTSYTSTLYIYVRPADFLGDVLCSDAPGAMGSYVVTLIDRTDPAMKPVSSLPTPCSQGVRFPDVIGPTVDDDGNDVKGHEYSAEIDGYEALAGEICPEGGCKDPNGKVNYDALYSGTRKMQYAAGTAAAGTKAVPRWLTACGGTAETNTKPAAFGITLLTACEPLVDQGGSADVTAVEVDPMTALGSLKCAADGVDGVAKLDILPVGGLGNALGLICGLPSVKVYSGPEVVPGKTLDFYVAAYKELDGPVTWGATCTAVVKKGLTVRAACLPLSDQGSVRIDIDAVLAQFGIECSGNITSYDAVLKGPGDTLEKTAVSCTKSLVFGPLGPGTYTADLVIRTDTGKELFSAACTAVGSPGRAVTADCTIQ
jgi:hypothetical protein